MIKKSNTMADVKKKKFNGTVTSDKMDKTIVVIVERIKQYPKYRKRYRSQKKFKVHDPKNEYRVGDKVLFEETRPLSKDKHWKVIGKAK